MYIIDCVSYCYFDVSTYFIFKCHLHTGVGGTSAAYFLNNLMEDRVEIHVYSDGKVGGRTAVIEFDGRLYEAGATIIHENNMYLVEFAKKFGESSQFLISIVNYVRTVEPP